MQYIKAKQTIKSLQMVSGIENYAVELATLYNLFRHRALDPRHETCQLGAFLSNYMGAMAANQLNLFQTAGFMFSQAEKIYTKSGLSSKSIAVDLETVKLRKLLAVYGYQGGLVKSKLAALCTGSEKYKDFDCEQFMRIVASTGARFDNERERLVFQSLGAAETRSIFSPFGANMQPTLQMCGGK